MNPRPLHQKRAMNPKARLFNELWEEYQKEKITKRKWKKCSADQCPRSLPNERKAKRETIEKREGKVLRVFSSGRWLPRNQGWLNFWETRLVTAREMIQAKDHHQLEDTCDQKEITVDFCNVKDFQDPTLIWRNARNEWISIRP